MAVKGAAEKVAWQAAQETEEAAWHVYVDVRTGTNIEAAEKALSVYLAAEGATDEARDAYFAARDAPTPT